jgi:hypothetical protein
MKFAVMMLLACTVLNTSAQEIFETEQQSIDWASKKAAW